MNFEDVFFPYLLGLFGQYQHDMDLSLADAQKRGPGSFVEWIKNTVSPPPLEEEEEEEEYGEDEDEDEDEDEERSLGSDALFVLSNFISADPTGHWMKEFWSPILVATRGTPRNPIAEMHVNYLLRWADDRVFSFTCVLPSHLIMPAGALSDYLVTKIGSLSSVQFYDVVAQKSLDLLHDAQQLKITKEHIEEVLRRAVVAVKDEEDLEERECLQNVIKFLRSVVVPPLPPEAETKARMSIMGRNLKGGKWQVVSTDNSHEGEED